ncbi:hypothetical protein BDP27DRAFT_1319432 [Rhodocollybia butyracea]|uniref:F-box domain-containing protein n=1 Tax=Rhodocollybia butyracea TaxID=206335 RepID=A0A9P5Q136_9AGAR|nr:hypothetical protein BDP27DRAFT_1319432 [Rhodocollybia butyracea]
MSRRSLRIKDKVKVDGQLAPSTSTSLKRPLDGETQDSEEDEVEEEERSRKRAKRAPAASKKQSKHRMPEQFRKVRGRRGLLERLAKDVPLDVIFEIFRYLDSSDILRLSRTSKDLRGILMSRSSERIWRTARENIADLPPLPFDLNEIQYAHLLFDPSCHVCNYHGRCDIIFWKFRMRCCKDCANAFPETADSLNLLNGLLDLWDLRSLVPEESRRNSKHYHERVINPTTVLQLRAEYEALAPAEHPAWFTRKNQEKRDIAMHAELCKNWLQNRMNNRAEELENIRKQRKEAILARLGEIGWREEAESIINGIPSYKRGKDVFSTHKLVRQPKSLTDRGWKSIKPELVQMLSDNKEKRLAEERHRAIQQRYQLLGEQYKKVQSESDLREPYPGIGDILINKVFEDLIRDTPTTQELTGDFLRAKLLEHLPGIIDEWRPTKIQELVDIMRKSIPDASPSDLQLAKTIFGCEACSVLMIYPQMFYHECCSNEIERDTFIVFSPWTSSRLFLNGKKSQLAMKIMEACDLDPNTATPELLNTSNPLIECLKCYDGFAPVAHSHLLSSSTQTSFNSFAINSFKEEEKDAILACELRTMDLTGPGRRCAHCHQPFGQSQHLLDHFKENHAGIVQLDDIEVPAGSLEAMKEHWYFKPEDPFRHWKGFFRYNVATP